MYLTARHTLHRIVYVTAIALVVICNVPASDDVQLFSKVLAIQKAEAPQIYGDNIIFTYQSAEPTRSVYVLFEHEQFRNFHQFSTVNYANQVIFVLPIQIPSDLRQIRYRYVVDSTWIPDPNNSNIAINSTGETLSVFRIPQNSQKSKLTPYYSPENEKTTFSLNLERKNQNQLRTVDSRFVSVNALQKDYVFLVGTFNNWDPYMHKMTPDPDNPNNYSISLRLKPGRYFYYFIVGGKRILDPTNGGYAYSETHGYTVSAYTVAQ